MIARLEDADYQGHSLSMLQRIGNALGQRLELRFVTAKPGTAPPERACVRRAYPAAGLRFRNPATIPPRPIFEQAFRAVY